MLNMKQPLSLEDCVRKLKSVNYALENVQVKGRDNMDILLGSMQAIDLVASSIESGTVEMNEPKIKLEEVANNE